MNIISWIRNKTVNRNRYREHPKAVIISCFFNPQNSPYRTEAFNEFYDSIKHLNHRIVECVIGDAKPQLPESPYIKRVYTESLLWHKEGLLNGIIKELPKKFKYVFWVDADVIFGNKDWVVEGVKVLQTRKIIQPFEYCFHLDKDARLPSLQMIKQKRAIDSCKSTSIADRKVWRSFSANFSASLWESDRENYDTHGHVGFAWGARREVLDQCPLYDRALIGGADHVIAHAASGEIPHSCITKSFSDNIDDVTKWSYEFYRLVRGDIGYVLGDLYHIWHGDIAKRQYLKRIIEFTPKSKRITKKDGNGLYVTKQKEDAAYMKQYFDNREVTTKQAVESSSSHNGGFIESAVIAYATDSAMVGSLIGGNITGAIIGAALSDGDKSGVDVNQNFS